MERPYELLFARRLAESAVCVAWTPERVRFSRRTEDRIAATWEAALQKAAQRGSDLFAGRMCRLAEWELTEEGARFLLGPTDYRELLGTNMTDPDTRGEEGESALSDGAGVCSVIQTADGKLLLQQRSSAVFAYPGWYHCCGGNLSPLGQLDGPISPFAAMRIELAEELGCGPADVAGMSLIGLARERRTRKPEFLFHLRVGAGQSDLEDRIGNEHDRLLFVDDSPVSLRSFLSEESARIAPAGLACLVAYGALAFGSSWRSEVEGTLSAGPGRLKSIS